LCFCVSQTKLFPVAAVWRFHGALKFAGKKSETKRSSALSTLQNGSFRKGALRFRFVASMHIRPSKKKTCFSSPPASFFSAASLFLLFAMSNDFMSKNQQASLVKPIAAVYTPK